MFYTTEANDHGFPHDPFKAIVTPRPIGWIGSVDKDGVANLAPHSYFNAISDNPYFVIFGSITYKDTVRNIEETGDFTCSLVTENMFDAMNSSSMLPASTNLRSMGRAHWLSFIVMPTSKRWLPPNTPA